MNNLGVPWVMQSERMVEDDNEYVKTNTGVAYAVYKVCFNSYYS